MANTTKKTPVKKPATRKKTPVKEAVEKVIEEGLPQEKQTELEKSMDMVAKMHPDAFRLAMQIINVADIKGGDAETVVLLKRELARVAGAEQSQRPRS